MRGWLSTFICVVSLGSCATASKFSRGPAFTGSCASNALMFLGPSELGIDTQEDVFLSIFSPASDEKIALIQDWQKTSYGPELERKIRDLLQTARLDKDFGFTNDELNALSTQLSMESDIKRAIARFVKGKLDQQVDAFKSVEIYFRVVIKRYRAEPGGKPVGIPQRDLDQFLEHCRENELDIQMSKNFAEGYPYVYAKFRATIRSPSNADFLFRTIKEVQTNIEAINWNTFR